MIRSVLQGVVVAAVLTSGATAQVVETTSDQDQRQAIERLRQSEAQRLDAEAAACQTRFAVTRCVDAVRAERQRINSTLNAQGSSLNAADRQRAAKEQLNRIDEKSQSHRDTLAKEAHTPTVVKRAAKTPIAAPAASLRDTSPKVDSQLSAQAAHDRAAKVRAFNDKQAVAQERREAVAKKMQSKASSAKSLPVPP